jgi:hypothetical protein
MSDRSVFLYLDPKPGADSQCGTCYLWIKGDRCWIHGPRVKVTASMACCFYLKGKPLPTTVSPPAAMVTPEESGLVDREVRCENCRHYDDRRCRFFALLNSRLSALFHLATDVDPRGCCTAQEPRPESRAREERLTGVEL